MSTQLIAAHPGWRISAAFAAAFGLAYFAAHSGLHALNPSHIEWLLRHDWTQHYLGWAFYRASPAWSWPLGALPQVFEPFGATIATMDANPSVALPMRLLSAWLPARAQLIGPTLAGYFAMQGAAGAYLAFRVGAGRAAQLLFGALMVAAPTLLHRVRHDTLCAQWLLLLVLATYWLPRRPSETDAASERHARDTDAVRDGWLWASCMVIAAFTHAYLLVMATSLAWGAALAHARRRGVRAGALAIGFVGVGTLAAAAACSALGLLDASDGHSASGFGYFSANLLALVEPSDWSRWVGELAAPHNGQRFEGFAYLGAGGLVWLISAWAWPKLVRPAPAPPQAQPSAGAHMASAPIELWLVVVGLFVYALSDRPMLGRTVLGDWGGAYDAMGAASRLFRCTGRFAWPLGYALMAAALSRACRCMRPPAQLACLVLALVLQVGEAKHGDVRAQFHTPTVTAWRDGAWAHVPGNFSHIVLTPPWFPGSDLMCGPAYPDKYEVAPSLFAAEHGLGINSAYLAHYIRDRVVYACRKTRAQWLEGTLRDDTIYLVAREIVGDARARLPVACATLDGYTACVKRRTVPSAFEQALQARGL